MLCENRKTPLDTDGMECVNGGDSCVLIRERDAREVCEQIAVLRSSLTMGGRAEAVLCFPNLL